MSYKNKKRTDDENGQDIEKKDTPKDLTNGSRDILTRVLYENNVVKERKSPPLY